MKTLTLSTREVDRLTTLQLLLDKRLSRRKAAEMLGISERQVRRLVRGYRVDSAASLQSKHRGRRSNRALEDTLRQEAIAIVRERYSDFGPTLAHEKLYDNADSGEVRCRPILGGLLDFYYREAAQHALGEYLDTGSKLC